MQGSRDSVELLRRDLSAQAKTISALIEDQRKTTEILNEIRTDRAVRAERDKNINDRFDRLEDNLEDLKSIGKWLLLTAGSTFVAALVTFVVKGGLLVP